VSSFFRGISSCHGQAQPQTEALQLNHKQKLFKHRLRPLLGSPLVIPLTIPRRGLHNMMPYWPALQAKGPLVPDAFEVLLTRPGFDLSLMSL
jgi:hypothetical protein